MDATRLTVEEQAMLARLARWDRPGCATMINLEQALTLAVCEKQWAFAKSHDSELDHVARIQQLEARLAACEEAKSALNIMNQGLITENNKLIAKLAVVERAVVLCREWIGENDEQFLYLSRCTRCREWISVLIIKEKSCL